MPAIYSLYIINKSGGLIYNKDYGSAGRMDTNDSLRLASLWHSMHAISQQLSPVAGCLGIELLEADTFDLYCFQSLTVSGDSLKVVIQTGNMISEKALALLTRRGATVSSATKPPRDDEVSSSVAIVGTSRTPPPAPKLAEDEVSKERKRHRSEKEGHHSKKHRGEKEGRDMIVRDTGKNLDLGGTSSLPPLLQTPGVPTVTRIEISEKERWAVGEKQPLQIFDGFELPQDFESYVDLSRDDLAIRSKRRLGRFISDFCRIANGYQADLDPRWRERMSKEIACLKDQVKVSDSKAVESAGREKELSLKLGTLEREWTSEKAEFQCRINDLEAEMFKLRQERDQSQKMYAEASASASSFQKEKEDAAATILALKTSLEKSKEEVIRSIEEGYKTCFDRISASGVVVEGHDFDSYCASLTGNAGEGNEENVEK